MEKVNSLEDSEAFLPSGQGCSASELGLLGAKNTPRIVFEDCF